MFQKPSKFLMSEEGGTAASAAAPVPTPSAEPTAAPTAPAFDVDSLVSRLVGVIDEKITASQNATHAALRKAGVFEKVKASDAAPSASTTSASVVAQAGVSMAEVEALLERKGVVSSSAAKYGLSAAATKRFEAAMSSVPRESLATEAEAYLADLGLAKAPTPPAPTTQTPAPVAQAKPNISDRGAAAPTDMRDSEGVLNSRPLEMNGHDVESLMLKHGHDKGLQMFQEKALAALSRIKLKPPR
jgi:hypothetical protein